MKVIWEDDAFNDLKEAIDFISIKSPQNAMMVLEGLLEFAETLSFMSEKFPVEPAYNNISVRSITKYNHKLIYQIRENNIIILRVFPAKQNPDKIFRKK